MGCPLQLHSDQGRNFDSKLFARLCELLQIAKTRTTPYHASSNGQVERYNRTLLQILRCAIHGIQPDWDKHLSFAAAAMRAAVNRTTGFSANMMMFGHELLQPIDLMLGTTGNNPSGEDPGQYVSWLRETMERVHTAARETLQTVQGRQKRDYDLRLVEHTYRVGDLVYKLDKSTAIRQSKKLKPIWEGPWVVTECLGSVLYRIRNRRRGVVVHHDLIKKCSEQNVPGWAKRIVDQLGTEEDAVVTGEEPVDVGLEELFAEEMPPDQERGDVGLEELVAEDPPQVETPPDQELGAQNPPQAGTPPDQEVDDDPDEATPAGVVTRRGRPVRRPAHLADFV